MEYRQTADRGYYFATTAMVLAVASLLTVQFVILPFICGGLSILFALLSRGCMPKVSRTGATAIILSGFSMALTAVLVAVAMRMVWTDPAMRQELNRYSMQLYGQTFDEMLKEELNMELPPLGEDK